MRGRRCDSLFCCHFSSLRPPFSKDLFAKKTLRLLEVACAIGTFDQWERGMTGFAVTFCCSPQSRCPFRLSLTCDNIRQLFQTLDQRSSVMNAMCDREALSCQGLGHSIVLLACRRLREQGVDERLTLQVSELLVPLQACFQQATRTWDVTLAQGNLAEEAHKPACYPRIAHLIMDGESLVQQGPPFPLIPLGQVDIC